MSPHFLSPMHDSKMRIGLDARPLSGKVTGIGRYVLEILHCMSEQLPNAQWVLYSRTELGVKLPPGNWELVVDRHPIWRRIPGVIWIKTRLPSLMRDGCLDVFWATATLAPRTPLPIVSTVHDLNHILVPETMPAVNRWGYAMWFAKDVCTAAQVVCNSEGTATRLKELIGRQTDAIARPGAQWTHMGQSDVPAAVGEPYVLTVATREPRKNLNNLIEAFALLKSQGRLSNHVLVLAGGSGWGKELKALRDGRPAWLRELGYVADEQMAALFANAQVLAQPSIYEGFGMPAAEAAAFGTRVVATDIPELREAAGSAGVFVGTGVSDIAQGILRALEMPRPAPYRGNSWSGAAEATALALKRAVAGARTAA